MSASAALLGTLMTSAAQRLRRRPLPALTTCPTAASPSARSSKARLVSVTKVKSRVGWSRPQLDLPRAGGDLADHGRDRRPSSIPSTLPLGNLIASSLGLLLPGAAGFSQTLAAHATTLLRAGNQNDSVYGILLASPGCRVV